MTLTGFLTYALALGIAAAIPGPGVIALIARALGSGFRPTLPMLFGLALGDVVYLGAAVLGLAYIASTFGTAFMVIKYLGAAYLAAGEKDKGRASLEKALSLDSNEAWAEKARELLAQE